MLAADEYCSIVSLVVTLSTTVNGNFIVTPLLLGKLIFYWPMCENFLLTGLVIVYTLDEVAFIQNLVFYIQCAYRTPVSLG